MGMAYERKEQPRDVALIVAECRSWECVTAEGGW